MSAVSEGMICKRIRKASRFAAKKIVELEKHLQRSPVLYRWEIIIHYKAVNL